MKLISKFKIVSLLGFALILAFGMVGCGDDSNSSAVTNPNPNTLTPTGHIQGILTDAFTAEPIVNAVIDIGLSRATTSATGQFVLYNVPVTEDATLDATFSHHYQVTIDMRAVTSPVNMNDANATVKYGDFYFEEAEVIFSSLDDTDGSNAGGGSGSNHDTPVTGIVATENFQVGKMSATLTGVVAGCDTSDGDFFDLQAGVDVDLVTENSSSPDDTASGNNYNVVGSTTTGADGAFTFANIEAGQHFYVRARSADLMWDNGWPGDEMHPIADGETRTLLLEKSNAIHICSVDAHGPTITAISPVRGSNIAPGETTAVFTFHEAIAQNALTSLDPSAYNNLYDNICVSYQGPKIDPHVGPDPDPEDVAFTAAWNAIFTELWVTFTTAASGKYTVAIEAFENLEDAAGNNAEIGVCPSADDAEEALDLDSDDVGSSEPAIYFTTSGGAENVAAPILVITNAQSIDEGSSVQLDWLAVDGAWRYNIYRTKTVPGYATEIILLEEETMFTFFTDSDVVFVEGAAIPITYTYTVVALNSDGVESAESNAVVAADVVSPQIESASINPALAFPADGETQEVTISLGFSETMKEGAIETLANWTLAKTDNATADDVIPVITAVERVLPTGVELTVTLTNPEGGVETYSGFWYLRAKPAIQDAAGNGMDQTADAWNNEAGAIQ